ncbi:jg10184 [Pararge aegeria aegeria]|uniref:Jg10184 protein n=1 Tax=Pararge aegeria aegeria TaxID=348720 RepID=A0A8S4SAZ2_9NEOP|nr:jg10184 [Pararge aegeria aegeria]
MCSISVRRAGWLDRVVEYQKKHFFDDLLSQSMKITVKVEKAPPGYADSKDWDYDSVIRLLTLIRDSEGAAPVRHAFRRAIKTNRGFISFSESFKAFPSLIKDHPNDFHYEVDSGEYYADVSPINIDGKLEMNDIIVVSNPVEAKLPSASISVDLLKQILENRAAAGRVLPTTVLDISWPVTAKNSTSAKEVTENAETTTSSTTVLAEVTTATSQGNVSDTASGNDTAVNATGTNQTETL